MIVARLWLVTHRPIWHDEAFTEWAGRLGPAALVAALREDSGPPLFYVLERPLARSVSSARDEWLPRLLPFTATLLLLAAARSLPPGSARRWWIVLCSSFALVNLYAAEARAYALLGLASLVIFLLGVVRPERPGALWGLFFAAGAALWLHYLALLSVASAFLVALADRRFRSALVLVAALAAFFPWLSILRAQPPEAMAWLRESPAATGIGIVSALGGVGRIPAPFGPALPILRTLAAALGAVLVLLLARTAREDPGIRAALLFVLLVLGMALALSVWRPIAFAGRCEMAVLPVWMWAVARAAPGRRALSAAAGFAAAAGVAATIVVAASRHPRPTATAAVERVAQLARPGDVLLGGPALYLPALLASSRGQLAARVAALPSGDAAHPGWFVATEPGPSEEAALRATMEGIRPGQRLWVLLPPSHDTPGIMRTLSASGSVRELVRQADAVLLVWTPAPADRSKADRAS